jgi:hypothetical protein
MVFSLSCAEKRAIFLRYSRLPSGCEEDASDDLFSNFTHTSPEYTALFPAGYGARYLVCQPFFKRK